MVFENEPKAAKLLDSNSYFSIINSYREPFAFPPNPKQFIRGTSFEEVHALFFFDTRLREKIFPTLLEAEARLKNDIVNTFLGFQDSTGRRIYDNDAYLLLSSYDRSKPKLGLDVIANAHSLISKSLKQSAAISHYLTKYSYVPLWVLETRMTFGTLCHFYEALNTNVRQAVAIKYQMTDKSLLTLIKILTEGRNACAHKDRLYCIKHNYSMPTFNPSVYPLIHNAVLSGYGNNDLFSVLMGLRIVLGPKAMKPVVNWIKHELDELAKKLKTIPVSSIEAKMGLSPSWATDLL